MWRPIITTIILYGSVLLLVLLTTRIQPVRCDDDDPTNLLRGGNTTLDDFALNIINSQPATDGRYRYAQVSLQYPSSTSSSGLVYLHQCGGSLIAPDIILTAAHCQHLIDRIYIDVYDVVTDTAVANSARTYSYRNISAHPLFEKVSFRYDFAIIHLTEQVDDDDDIAITPVRLNANASLPALDNSNLVVLGWGALYPATATTKAIYPTILQQGNVQAMTNENCEATVIDGMSLYQGEIFDEMLCAEGPGVDACAGDSGGPLVVPGLSDEFDLLVGTVSWGRGCAVYPGVYSRISVGYDWIRSQVCYRSADPPLYLACQPEERDPIYTIDGATLTPTVAPITRSPILFAPVTPTGTPVSTAVTVTTNAPVTAAPVITTRPSRQPTTTTATTRPTSRTPVLVVVPWTTGSTTFSPTNAPFQNTTRTVAVPPTAPSTAAANVVDQTSVAEETSSAGTGRSDQMFPWCGWGPLLAVVWFLFR